MGTVNSRISSTNPRLGFALVSVDTKAIWAQARGTKGVQPTYGGRLFSFLEEALGMREQHLTTGRVAVIASIAVAGALLLGVPPLMAQTTAGGAATAVKPTTPKTV